MDVRSALALRSPSQGMQLPVRSRQGPCPAFTHCIRERSRLSAANVPLHRSGSFDMQLSGTGKPVPYDMPGYFVGNRLTCSVSYGNIYLPRRHVP